MELPDGDNWQKGNEESLSEITKCYCPNCGGNNGKTLMLPTKIPMFREIYILTLQCEDCNFQNSEVTFGGEIQPKGERLTLQITSKNDFDRQLIKSDSASLSIPSLEFEIPAQTQRGTISTLEGMILRAAENLEALQPERLRLGDVDNFHRCREVIHKLRVLVGHSSSSGSSSSSSSSSSGYKDCLEDIEDEENHNCIQKEDGQEIPLFATIEIILDDPAGNSFIENPLAPSPDPNLSSVKYIRTAKQDMALGLQPSKEAIQDGAIEDSNPKHKNKLNDGSSLAVVGKGQGGGGKQTKDNIDTIDMPKKEQSDMFIPSTLPLTSTSSNNTNNNTNNQLDNETNLGKKEALTFTTPCPSCNQEAETTMCVTDIPHFKEVIIMSLFCEQCGYKSNEVKGGGAIPKYGTKITIQINTVDDLGREVLKSDSAGVTIPEIDLVLDDGGLDGLYTTIEGLIHKMYERLGGANPFASGDAAYKHHSTNDGGTFSDPSPSSTKYQQFLQTLKNLGDGQILPFTLIINDPLGNSFVGPLPSEALRLALQAEREDSHQCYETYMDPGMIIEEFERTHDQNEILGLNDIKTENYAYNPEGSGLSTNYGTDQMVDVPDRLKRMDIRGPDHPHAAGKAPVEGDSTIMGPGSANYATPGLTQRGKQMIEKEKYQDKNEECHLLTPVDECDQPCHHHVDENFIPCDKFNGPKSSNDGKSMVFRMGKHGLGYYTDLVQTNNLKDHS
eukprot:CAMPEP_0184862476 /NCGR_PEP_ID=MMETSP0580-20130426/6923_1 /TAXON_ID=1118495 /ORGANISM="Dactyliosolen fragilissimus" /LENGTH=729 /DNA_ID=CAMNT_0027360357 /DNA_START=24 /DNA_END=2213 /DNA_ORIENTATION=-